MARCPLEVWDLAEGRRSLVLPVPQGGVRALAFTESARTLAVLGPEGVQTWKLPVPPDAVRLLRSSPQRVVVFAPSGLLASADEDAFVLASVEGASGFTRRGSLKVAAPPAGASPGVAFSAQGLHVAVAGADGVHVAALGPSASLSFSARVPLTGSRGVALSRDGERLFVAGSSALEAFVVRTEKPLWSAAVACASLAYSATPAGGSVVCGASDGTLSWLDPETGAERSKLVTSPGVRSQVLSGAGKGAGALAVATGAGVFWDRRDQTGGRLLPGTGPAAQVAFSASGGLLATASPSGDLLLWDVRDGEPALLARLAGCGGEPTSLSFSPLGVALAAACGGSPYLAPIPEWLEGEK